MRHHNGSHHIRDLAYTLEEFEPAPGAPMWTLELHLGCTLTAYTPKTWECPAEGGEIEDLSAKIVSVIDPGGADDCREETLAPLQKLLDAQIDSDDRLRDRLKTYCAKHAAEMCEPDPDRFRD